MLRTGLFVLLWLSLSLSARAGSQIVIHGDEGAVAQQIQTSLLTQLRSQGADVVLATRGAGVDGAPAAPAASVKETKLNFVLAIGAASLRQLLAREASPNTRLIALVSQAALTQELARASVSPRTLGQLRVIVLDQPLSRYVSLIQHALPRAERVAVLLGKQDEHLLGELKAVQRQHEQAGLGPRLTWQRVSNPDEFMARLQTVLQGADVLLALPSPGIHNRSTVQPLLLTTYRQGIPVVAYSAAYAQAGALLALHSTPEQLARQAIELIRQSETNAGKPRSSTRTAPRILAPRYFSVALNAAVARSLGLTLPGAQELQDQLMKDEVAASSVAASANTPSH